MPARRPRSDRIHPPGARAIGSLLGGVRVSGAADLRREGDAPATVGVHGRGVLGVLRARRKRFFADVAIADGEQVVAHCPNTGRLAGLLQQGATVVLEDRAAPRRALRYTWVLVQSHVEGVAGPGGRPGATGLVAVESSIAPTLVEQAIASGVLPALGGFAAIHRELAYGPPSWGREPRRSRSRIDLVACDHDRGHAAALLHAASGAASSVWIEVKATTMRIDREGVRVAAFPDAPSVRGQRQLEDLEGVVRRGQRAAVVFAVMRDDVDVFAPADHVDPIYGRALRRAHAHGVELYAAAVDIVVRSDEGGVDFSITLARPLPLQL